MYSKSLKLEVWPLAPPIRLSRGFADGQTSALPSAGKASFRFELDLCNSACYEGWSGFRLLCIQSGHPDSPLCLNLCASALPAGVPYTAISYAWPSSLSTSVAYMDCASGRTEFLTSTHVGAVLKRLRLEHDCRYVWIDSICINQANLTERSHQVAKMRAIYGRATSVLAWLGQPATSGATFASMEETLWSCMARTGDAVWWKRLWILQETAVAKRTEVGFGAYTLSWPALMSELEAVTLHAASNAIDGDLGVNYPDAPHENESVLAAARCLRTIDGLRNSVVSRQGTFVGLSIHTLLQQSTHMVVSLPVDRVYALLGLLNSSALPITPDYLGAVDLLYLETLMYIIGSDHSLDVLADSWPPLSDINVSWSKDFAKSPERLGSLHKLGYTAGSRKQPKYSIWRSVAAHTRREVVRTTIAEWHRIHAQVPTQLELHASGVRIDTVIQVHHNIKKPRVFQMHGLVTRQDLAMVKKELVEQLAGAMSRKGRRSFPAEDARSQLNDMFVSTEDPAQNSGAEGPEVLFAAWWEALCSDIDSDAADAIVANAAERLSDQQAFALQEIVADRVYFGTVHGLVGLARIGVQRHDLLVTLFGASTAFVLRSVGDAYTLVGDAYVHGVMHGKMIDLHEERPAEMPVESFVLI